MTDGITKEMALAELARRGEIQITPDMARAELARRGELGIGNEVAAVKNRAVQGATDLGDFIGAASRNLNPFQFGGPALFGLNENPFNRAPETSLTEGAQSIGLIGNEEAQTTAGKVLGEVGYYAPDFLLPGGLTKAGIASTLGAGTAAGVTKAAGGGEGAQAIAGLAGALSPTALQAGRNVISKTMGKTLQDQGAAMRRKAIGTRQGDYTRSAKDLSIYDVTSGDLPKTTRIDDLPPETVAKAMQEAFDDAGFAPETYYHQTSPEAYGAIQEEGFKTGLNTSSASEDIMPKGVFVKNTGDDIFSVFGKDERNVQMPLRLKKGGARIFDDRNELKRFVFERDPEAFRLNEQVKELDAKLTQKLNRSSGDYADMRDKRISGEISNEAFLKWRDGRDAEVNALSEQANAISSQIRDKTESVLRKEGISSIRVLDDTGSFGRSVDTTVALDPQDLRSTFDPPQEEFQAALKRYAEELDPLPGTSADEVTEAGAETLSKKVFDRIIESGELGKSRDPSKLLETALKKGSKATSDVSSAVMSAAKNQKRPIEVAFTRAQDYLEKGYASADEIPRLEKELKNLAESIRTRGKGKVDFIHRQKIAYGQKYKLPEFAGSKGFYKALYHDLMKTVEDHVPGIRGMNREVRDWNEIVTPVLKRSLGISENATLDAETLKRIRTSGGVGSLIVPSVAGGSAGFVLGPLAGLGTAAAISFANSATGREVIGRTLQRLGKGTKITTENLPVILDALQKAASEQGIDLSAEEQQSAPSEAPVNPQPQSAPVEARNIANTQPQQGLSSESPSIFSPQQPPSVFQRTSAGPSVFERDFTGAGTVTQGNDMKTAEVEALIDQDPIDAAIYQVESNRNPRAKNRSSSAAGGFQLIDSMQRAFGVDDPYDLEQNYQGYKQLRAENERAVGSDPERLYAAHFLGLPTALKWIKGEPLSATQRRHVKELEEKALPRFRRIYANIVSQQGVEA